MAKKIERLNKRKSKAKLTEYRSQETPVDLAKNELINASLSPKKVPGVYRKLVFHHSLLRQIKSAVPKKSLTKKPVEQIVSGSVTRKYRMLRYLGRETTLNRNQLKKCKMPHKNKARLTAKRSDLRSKVVDFLNRDDNSRQLPGKRDYKSTDNVKHQKRALNDYLRNLHAKFLSENPGISVGLSTFCRMRPKHFSLLSFMKRNACLCIYHQNMALKLQAITNTKANPDHIFAEHNNEEIIGMKKICIKVV